MSLERLTAVLVRVSFSDEANPHSSNKLSKVKNLLGRIVEWTKVLAIAHTELVEEDVGDLNEVRSSDLRGFKTKLVHLISRV
jgi:hypothetical protein